MKQFYYGLFFGVLFGLLVGLFAIVPSAHAECSQSSTRNESTKQDISKVATPKNLEGARIEMTLANGKKHVFSADEYMVAKRIRTVKVVTVENNNAMVCSSERKNEVLVGARQDYTHVDKTVSAHEATLDVKKDAVIDAAYIRHELFGTRLNGGLGIDTNGTPKAMVGFDF